MMIASDGPSALPLWINGHAFLTMTDDFQTVQNPATGQALRLAPLCGEHEVKLAVDAGLAVSQTWANSAPNDRLALLNTLQELLTRYAEHFAKLLTEETGADIDTTTQWVVDACRHLTQPVLNKTSTPLTAILMDASQVFAEPVAALAAALADGQCVLFKSSPKAPSALFALAELTARAGIPDGVVNLIHGDLAALDAIAKENRIGNIQFFGSVELRQQIAERFAKAGRPLQS